MVGSRRSDGRAFTTVTKVGADISEGLVDLRDWDDEELHRGQRRNRNGNFHGRPPSFVPQQLHNERYRRTLASAQALFVENTVNAVQVLIEIATDLGAPYSDRLKAAAMIVERTMGKPQQSVDVTVHEPKFIAALEGALVSLVNTTDDDGDDDTIDAEVIFD